LKKELRIWRVKDNTLLLGLNLEHDEGHNGRLFQFRSKAVTMYRNIGYGSILVLQEKLMLFYY